MLIAWFCSFLDDLLLIICFIFRELLAFSFILLHAPKHPRSVLNWTHRGGKFLDWIITYCDWNCVEKTLKVITLITRSKQTCYLIKSGLHPTPVRPHRKQSSLNEQLINTNDNSPLLCEHNRISWLNMITTITITALFAFMHSLFFGLMSANSSSYNV